MTTRVKICGMTSAKDAQDAVRCGAWALGFIFYKNSPRYIGAYKARGIIASLPPFITPVGVFVNQKEGAVKDIADFCGIRTLQFHGEETPTYCRHFKKFRVIKAFRVGKKIDARSVREYDVSAWLFDTLSDQQYGGTGECFNWSLVQPLKNFQVPVILSGGLSPQNIFEAVEKVRPFAVDVCSGVEKSPGKKNDRLIKDLFQALPLGQ